MTKTTEFWLSHMIVLVGTVLGVYLAASAGLKSAVQFELIKSDRDSFYLQSSLRDEISDNLKTMTEWGTAYRSGKAGQFRKKRDEYQLNLYVWETMRFQGGTFEVPSAVLSATRRYYQTANNTLDKMASGKPAAKEVAALLEETKRMQAEVLPQLEAELEKLKARSAENGVTL